MVPRSVVPYRVVSCLGVGDNNNMIFHGCEARRLDDTQLRLQMRESWGLSVQDPWYGLAFPGDKSKP